MAFHEWYDENLQRLIKGNLHDALQEAWQRAQVESSEEIKRLKAKLVPQDERIQEIKRLLAAQAAERERAKVLVDALHEIKEWGHLYSYSGRLTTVAGMALLKYEESQ